METKDKVYPKAVCPICGSTFDLKRKDKKHCSKKCQTNSSRQPRTVKQSATQKRIYETFEGSYSNLNVNFYETPPAFRVEYLERLIQEGRRLVSIRRILTRKTTFWNYGDRGMLPIQQVFYHYCRYIYGMTVREVLDRTNQLPAEIYYPFEYFGPEKEPTYTNGIYLRRSEQPFIARRGTISEKLSTGKSYDAKFVARSLSDKPHTYHQDDYEIQISA